MQSKDHQCRSWHGYPVAFQTEGHAVSWSKDDDVMCLVNSYWIFPRNPEHTIQGTYRSLADKVMHVRQQNMICYSKDTLTDMHFGSTHQILANVTVLFIRYTVHMKLWKLFYKLSIYVLLQCFIVHIQICTPAKQSKTRNKAQVKFSHVKSKKNEINYPPCCFPGLMCIQA